MSKVLERKTLLADPVEYIRFIQSTIVQQVAADTDIEIRLPPLVTMAYNLVNEGEAINYEQYTKDTAMSEDLKTVDNV